MKRIVKIQAQKQPEGIVNAISMQNIAEDNANPVMDEVNNV